MIDDGSGAGTGEATQYDAALAAGSPARDLPPRSNDDIYIIYTGGTTGLPKGVMWRHSDLFRVLSQSYQAIGEIPETPAHAGELAKRMRDGGVSGVVFSSLR